jgi:hypothetical protein
MYDKGETNGEKGSKTEKGQQLTTLKHSPSTKNGVTEPQRRICAHPTAFSLSTFDYCSIDV